jgi:hypothetical protein
MATKATKPTLKTFRITGRVPFIYVAVSLQASDWEDAVSEAKKLSCADFVTAESELIDADAVEITNIYLDD